MRSPTDLTRASPAAPSQVKRTAATCGEPSGRKVVNVVPQSAEEGFALRGQLDLARSNIGCGRHQAAGLELGHGAGHRGWLEFESCRGLLDECLSRAAWADRGEHVSAAR
jgi:hypothetical protein